MEGTTEDRYYVARTHGWLTNERSGRGTPEHVSAMVLDRGNLHREVAIFRSDSRQRGNHATRVRVTVEAAEALAAKLNAGGSLLAVDRAGVPHGTATACRDFHCRCPECRAYNSARNRAYNAARRDRVRE